MESNKYHINPDDVKLNSFIEKERGKVLCLLQKNYSLNEEDAKDVFQSSSMALYENIQKGKLENLTSTLSTYFITICINQTKKFLRDSKNYLDVDNLTNQGDYQDEKINELLEYGSGSSISEEQKNMMHELVQNLPKPCDDILWYYYGDNLSMQTIAGLLSYQNADTVKSTKSRCMSKLRAKFNQIMEDFYAG